MKFSISWCMLLFGVLVFDSLVSAAQMFTAKEELTELHKPQHMPKYDQHSTC